MLPRYRRRILAGLISGPSCAGKILNSSSLKEKINDSSTMLLYERPCGFAIISFGGVDLNIPVKDLWAYPPLNVSTEDYKKFEEKSTAIDLTNEVIGSDLTEMLTRFCGSGQELLVGSAEYKRIIERRLAITCRYDMIVEEVISALENMILFPDEPSEPKEYCLPREKGGLILFLRQYDFDVKEDMVNRSVVEAARLLYHLDLHEQKFLKLLCSSIKEFVDVLPDTKDWSLIKFATALKFYCYPGARYQIWRPSKIFSSDEYKRIASMKPQYRKLIMSKIHVVSVYEDAIDLYGDRLDMVYNIDCLMPEKAKPKKLKIWKNHSSGELNSTEPTGSKVGKEGTTDFDVMLNSATEDNCSGVTVLKSSGLDLSERPRQVVTCDKQATDTDAKQAGAARSIDETEDKNLTGGTHGLVGDKQDILIPATVGRSGPKQNEENHANSASLKVQGTDDASKKMTEQQHANKSEAKNQPQETSSNGINKGAQSEDEEKGLNEDVPSTSLENVEQTHGTSSDRSDVAESINDEETTLARGTRDLVGEKGVQSEDEEKGNNELVPSTSMENVEQTYGTSSDRSDVAESINDEETTLARGTHDLVGDKGVQSEDEEKGQNEVVPSTSLENVEPTHEKSSDGSDVVESINDEETTLTRGSHDLVGDKGVQSEDEENRHDEVVSSTSSENVEPTHKTSSDGSDVVESINDEETMLIRGTHDPVGDKGVQSEGEEKTHDPANGARLNSQGTDDEKMTAANKSGWKRQLQKTTANGTNGVNADSEWEVEEFFSTSGANSTRLNSRGNDVEKMTAANKSELKRQPQKTSANGTNGVQNADLKGDNEQLLSTSGRLKLRDLLLADMKREQKEAITNARLKSCMPFICCRSVH